MAVTVPVTVEEEGTFLRIAETLEDPGETRRRRSKGADDEAYHEGMKWYRILIAASSLACASGAMGADFHGVKTVYLLPMSGGADQYLAARLTSGEVLQVVTDPLKADAIFTDHLGETFEKSLDDLFGAVPKTRDGKAGDEPFARLGGTQHSRGTFFLVDRKTRDVLWSDSETPKGTSAEDVRRVTERVASRLSKAMKAK